MLGPGADGKVIQPEGILASALDARQQAMLLDVVHEWVGILNDEAAAAKMAEIKANLPHLLRVERSHEERRPGVLPYPGADARHRVCAAAGRPRSHPHDLSRPDQRLRREARQAMNVRRLFVSFAVLGVWLATPAPAGAHRLDEYLQATRLSIDLERVGLEIDLTAGVAVAPRSLPGLIRTATVRSPTLRAKPMRDRCSALSCCQSTSRPVPITLIEIRFPQFREMSLGVGTIQVRATAKVSATGAGRHQVSYLNTHRSESSVYLVNALVPADPRIQTRRSAARSRAARADVGLHGEGRCPVGSDLLAARRVGDGWSSGRHEATTRQRAVVAQRAGRSELKFMLHVWRCC